MAKISFLLFSSITLSAAYASATLQDSMYRFRSELSGVFLPVLAMVGIIIAGISLAMGHQNAKNHVCMAFLGAIIGFGAEGIINFARSTFGA